MHPRSWVAAPYVHAVQKHRHRGLTHKICAKGWRGTRSTENPSPARRRRICARRAASRGAPEGIVTRIASATAGHRPTRSESGPRRRCLVVSWVSQVAEASQFQRSQCCFLCSPGDLPLSEVILSLTSDSWRLRDAISRSLVRWILATLSPSSRARSLPPSLPRASPAPRCGLSGTYWVQKCW